MHYKTKSAITIVIILAVMVTVGFLVNFFQGGITGGVVAGVACQANSDCNDGMGCTIDSCKNPGTEMSFCLNEPINSCQDNDGCCPAGCTEINDNDC